MIRKYTHKDYPMLASWYKERGLTPPGRDALSSLGFIADNRVAGFLYLTNSNIALIDGLISKPGSIASLRRESLHALAGTLVDTAMTLGYSNVIAVTKHPAVEKVCQRYGFKDGGYRAWILSDKELHDEEAL